MLDRVLAMMSFLGQSGKWIARQSAADPNLIGVLAKHAAIPRG
jgi:hypothetical protein